MKGTYILQDEEIEMFLELQNDDLLQAARMAAYSCALFISTVSTKELYGDVEVWSEASRQYLKALQAFTSDKSLISIIPKVLCLMQQVSQLMIISKALMIRITQDFTTGSTLKL